MGAENRIEDLSQEGKRSLGKMLQGPVRDSVLAPNPAHLVTPDGFVNIVGLVNSVRCPWSRNKTSAPSQPPQNLSRTKDKSPAVTESPDSLQVLRPSDSLRERLPRGDQGGDGVVNLITSLVILHNDWSSGSRDSSIALHCSFLQSLIKKRPIDNNHPSNVPLSNFWKHYLAHNS